MELYNLASITIHKDGENVPLHFHSATLHVTTDFLIRSWFIDLNGLNNADFVEKLLSADDISAQITARTFNGAKVSGACSIHPALDASGISIKGDGELTGYDSLT